MNKHLEIAERLSEDPDWGKYNGALCRSELIALIKEYNAMSAALKLAQSMIADLRDDLR